MDDKLFEMFDCPAFKRVDLIADLIKPYATYTETDLFGNIFAVRGESPVLLKCDISDGIAAGGVKDGKITAEAFGGVALKEKLNQEIEFENGALGILRSDAKDDEKSESFYIEPILGDISDGEIGMCKTSCAQRGDVLVGNNISDVISVLILIDALKNSSGGAAVLVSTNRSFARSSLLKRQSFEALIALGGCRVSDRITLGGGCALFVKGKNMLMSQNLRARISELAKKNNIKTQLYIGENDFGLEKICGECLGCETGGMLIPVSHIGSANEVISLNDAENTSAMLQKIIDGGIG